MNYILAALLSVSIAQQPAVDWDAARARVLRVLESDAASLEDADTCPLALMAMLGTDITYAAYLGEVSFPLTERESIVLEGMTARRAEVWAHTVALCEP